MKSVNEMNLFIAIESLVKIEHASLKNIQENLNIILYPDADEDELNEYFTHYKGECLSCGPSAAQVRFSIPRPEAESGSSIHVLFNEKTRLNPNDAILNMGFSPDNIHIIKSKKKIIQYKFTKSKRTIWISFEELSQKVTDYYLRSFSIEWPLAAVKE